MAPLQQGVSTVTRPIGDFFSGLAHLPSLERDNADLRGQVADLQTQIAAAGDIQDRLRTLTDLLGLKQTLDPGGVPADVQLLIDQNFAVAGRLSTTRATGLVRGRGEQDPRMDGIPQDTEVSLNGDQPVQVFTVSYEINGQQGRYPPGILIGEVSSVIQSTNALETAVTLRPAVDFSALEYVLVYKTDQSQEGSTG